MDTLDEIRAPVKGELKEFERYFRSALKSDVPLVDVVTRFILRRKGKQMRPLFVLLTSKMLGEVNDASYIGAALIELLHTATLVHDDVVDDSYKRRGFFSIRALWKSKLAVLTGDFLLAKGLLLAVQNKQYDLLEIVSNAVREMSEGELYQLQKARKLNMNEEEYFRIIRQKTATLISSCTRCGARAVTSDPETLESLGRFGELTGLAFQIKDDLFDYQKHAGVGKPTGNDLQEKKLTLPLIHALSRSRSSEKRRILSLVRRDRKTTHQVREIMDFVVQKDGLGYAEKKMHHLIDEALKILDMFPDNDAREGLRNLTKYTIERIK